MSRYIEYHDICSAIGNQQDGTGMTYEALAHAMVEIQLAPSIDLVRCAECKHRKRKRGTFKGEPIFFYRCKEHNREVESDDFCSWGEREGE